MHAPTAGPASTAATAQAAVPPTGMTVHRTPVVALDGRIAGYTLRVVGPDGGTVVDDGVYLDLDLANLVADRHVFLPATPSMLDGFVPEPVVPGRLVLVLPDRYEISEGAVGRAAALRGLGMTLALPGFRGEPAQLALLPFLGFVVVDARTVGPSLPGLVHRAHTAEVRTLVDGPLTPAQQDACRAAGVDGIVTPPAEHSAPGVPGPRPAPAAEARPRVLRAGEAQCLAILHLLGQPDASISDVAQVIETDPVLTLRVLHLVNSGAFSLNRQVDTVRQAVVLLGSTEISSLVAALALDARPDAMDRLWFILARALTCETLADDPAGYTVGMLSALAEQLGVPVDLVLDKVGVSEAVADAMRYFSGTLGEVLRAVRSHEQSDVDGVLSVGLQPADVSRCYLRCLRDALTIARTVTRESGF